MCGICGIVQFNTQEVDGSALAAMMNAMKHRGPDDEGIFIKGNSGLGHVRLSIIDLSADGKQPMLCSDERYVISYNGEIYNYIELREKLSSTFTFRTKTDTEVLLNAYKYWGKSCLDELNGMFAFAIYDKLDGSLFLARDRFGIKPLYYALEHDKLVFASEIKSLLTQLNRPLPNDKIIYDFLVYDRVQHSEETFFKGIKKLQHGHWMEVSNGKSKIERWYTLADKIQDPFTNSSQYADSLLDSIKLRMRSDVEVGACLSGGLDSSSIVSMLNNKLQLNDFHTFSAIYNKGDRGDESGFIKLYSFNNMHFIKPSVESLVQDIEPFVRTLEEPIPGLSEYAEFKLMELAKNHATVILNGQGADEVLAGYHYFFGYYYKELLNKMQFGKLSGEVIQYFKLHHSFLALKALAYFYLPATFRSKIMQASKSHINPGFIKVHQDDPVPLNELFDSKNLQTSFLNHFEYKFEHHLLWGDKSSMRQALELRFPFLDHRLVEKTLGLSSAQLIHNGQTKYILRQAMKGILPEAIRLRNDKVGFETPSAEWIRSPQFQPLLREILHSPKFAQRGYIDAKKARSMVDRHVSGKIDASREIWKMIHLELWFRYFID